MKRLFDDTDADTERQYLALWRLRSSAARLRGVNSLNATLRTLAASRPACATEAGTESRESAGELVTARWIAAGIVPERARRAPRPQSPEGERALMQPDAVAVTLLVTEALEDIGIPYLIGGSMAGAVHGIPRATHDTDIVLALEPSQPDLLVALVSHLERDFLVTLNAALAALAAGDSFNVVHYETLFKVDLFVPRLRAFERARLVRGQACVMEEGKRLAVFSTPEDTVLAKLEWYRLGHEVSERQWNDVQGILRLQDTSLDQQYLRRWANALGIADLLDRALDDAGITWSGDATREDIL